MIAMSLGEIAQTVGGTLHGADPDTVVGGTVEFDSRKVVTGSIFVAFVGENVDGHQFVPAALAAGAAASIVSAAAEGPRIEVADVLVAMTELARASAQRLNATVIGVTGSSGKTSTKDLIAHVLRSAGTTVAPAGSMNNELGFPHTVLQAGEDTRYLVLEMGSRGLGHLAYLASIARPSVGVVLNVGSAHLGEFGSREVIAQAKGELVEAVPLSGVAILNADDQLVRAMAVRTTARVATFGESSDAEVRAEEIEIDALGRAAFALRWAGSAAQVRLQLVGEHHVLNALAAAAVAIECGLGLEQIAAALSTATPASRWRMEVTERTDGVTVLNDAYNANPESMRAALKTLASLQRGRRAEGARSFAVLGHMAELGPGAQIQHLDLGRFAVRLDISRVIAVAEEGPSDPARRGAGRLVQR